jgi:methionyl-tRNA synthetase
METQEKTLPAIKPEVAFDDFMKVDVRLCSILSVEKVEKKDRLYKLLIDTGVDQRVVVSAIAELFSPEDLLHKVIPFVLNLPVRKIAGIESHGMIILAEDKISEQVFSIGDTARRTGAIVI